MPNNALHPEFAATFFHVVEYIADMLRATVERNSPFLRFYEQLAKSYISGEWDRLSESERQIYVQTVARGAHECESILQKAPNSGCLSHAIDAHFISPAVALYRSRTVPGIYTDIPYNRDLHRERYIEIAKSQLTDLWAKRWLATEVVIEAPDGELITINRD